MNDVVGAIGIIFGLTGAIIMLIYGALFSITTLKLSFRVSYYSEEPAQLLKESGFKDLGERMEYANNRRKKDLNKPLSILNCRHPSIEEQIRQLKIGIEYLRLSIPKTEANKELLKSQKALKVYLKSLLRAFIGGAMIALSMPLLFYAYPDL